MAARLVLSMLTTAAMVAWAEGPLEVRRGAQSPGDEQSGSSAIRASVNWVRVPVHVTNESGVPRAGLTREDFTVREDGVEQTVLAVAEEDSPVSLAIVFDASSSMKAKLSEARRVLPELSQFALPGDEYALVEFGNDARLLAPYCPDFGDIERSASKIQLTTWTALYDAVYLALQQRRHAANARRAILVISDGGDNNSRYSAAELLSFAREAETPIYSISIDSSYKQAEPLRKLAEATGGTLDNVRNVSELGPALARMSRRMRGEYVLHYSSTHQERDGRYRKVDVKLTGTAALEGLHLTWRRGYYTALD